VTSSVETAGERGICVFVGQRPEMLAEEVAGLHEAPGGRGRRAASPAGGSASASPATGR
jgi:hypothetical protein